MKKNLFVWAVAVALTGFASCESEPKDSYVITGELEGLPDGTTLVFTPLSHAEEENVAEAIVENGKFEITGKADEPLAVFIGVKDTYGERGFLMLENGKATLTGKAIANTDEKTGETRYDFTDIKVEGSPMTDMYYQKMAGRHHLDSMMIDLKTNQFVELNQKLQRAYEERNRATIDSLRATEEYQQLAAKEKYLFNAFDSCLTADIEANKESFWAPLMMIAQTSYLSPDQREVYESLGENAKNSIYGKKVYQELYPVGRPGDKLPTFTANDMNGNAFDLAAYCAANKYVLIDFWASWCGPCRKEIPHLKEIYAQNKDKGLGVISISIDKDDAAWRKAISEEKLEWTNIRDTDSSISSSYHVSAIPALFVVDSEGRLVIENLRGEALAAKIAELCK